MAQLVEKGQIIMVDAPTLFTPLKKRREQAPLYSRTGRPGKNRSGVEGMNMPKLFMGMSKAATWLFWNLEQKRNSKTNVAELKSSELTLTERARTSKAFKELHALDVLKRTKQNHYLINPKALLPKTNEYFQEVLNVWEQTK